MINIKQLKKLELKYYQRRKKLLEKDSIPGLIEFIEKEQANRGPRVISLERRQTAQRLKELEERQEKNKAFDPEEEFKKL